MSRGPPLSDEEMMLIRGYMAQNISVYKISQLLKRSYNTVIRYLEDPVAYVNDLKRRALTTEECERIVEKIEEFPKMRPGQIAKLVKVKPTPRTVKEFVKKYLIEKSGGVYLRRRDKIKKIKLPIMKIKEEPMETNEFNNCTTTIVSDEITIVEFKMEPPDD